MPGAVRLARPAPGAVRRPEAHVPPATHAAHTRGLAQLAVSSVPEVQTASVTSRKTCQEGVSCSCLDGSVVWKVLVGPAGRPG